MKLKEPSVYPLEVIITLENEDERLALQQLVKVWSIKDIPLINKELNCRYLKERKYLISRDQVAKAINSKIGEGEFVFDVRDILKKMDLPATRRNKHNITCHLDRAVRHNKITRIGQGRYQSQVFIYWPKKMEAV